MDYENNGMFWHHNKKWQNLKNKLFWKFDVSVKKSADFSCLFTFFLKNVNSKKINAINCEIHNYWKKMLFVYIFELLHKSADFKNVNKLLFKIDSHVILRL